MKIFFGTETGNAELVAEDIATELSERGFQVECIDMANVEVEALCQEVFFIVVCSSYGDGELPHSAQPLFAALEEKSPDLTGCSFASFGLGDSFYETFNAGVKIIEDKLISLGATMIGTRGVHDASEGTIPTDQAIAWVEQELSPLLNLKEAAQG